MRGQMLLKDNFPLFFITCNLQTTFSNVCFLLQKFVLHPKKEKSVTPPDNVGLRKGTLLCNARINACSVQCLSNMHRFSAFLRGTLSLPLITPRHLAR